MNPGEVVWPKPYRDAVVQSGVFQRGTQLDRIFTLCRGFDQQDDSWLFVELHTIPKCLADAVLPFLRTLNFDGMSGRFEIHSSSGYRYFLIGLKVGCQGFNVLRFGLGRKAGEAAEEQADQGASKRVHSKL